MKSIACFFLCIACTFQAISQNQNVGIGTGTPHSSALLDLSSATRGLLIPRMSSTQRTSIQNPAVGLMVYDLNTNSTWQHNGSAWSNLASGGGFSLPYNGSVNLTNAAFVITNTGAGIEGNGGSGIGLRGTSNSSNGIYASSNTNYGIFATSNSSGAIYAFNYSPVATITANNSDPQGLALNAVSSAYHAIKGTSSGVGKSGIWGDAAGAGGSGIYGTSASGVGVYGKSDPGTGVYGFSTTGTGVKAFSSSGLALDVNGKVKIAGGNTNPSNGAVLTSDASGNAIWKNNKIAFRVSDFQPGHSLIGPNAELKIYFYTEEYDLGNNYSGYPGAGEFVAPKAGIYHFDARVFAYLVNGDPNWGFLRLMMRRNGTITDAAVTEIVIRDIGSVELLDGILSLDIALLPGDALWITLKHNNDDDQSCELDHHIYFNGHLLYEQ